MDGFDRIYDLHRILSRYRKPVPLAAILTEMECSRATFNRIKRHMTDFLGAPIAYSREHGGYHYNQEGESHFELPGTWFNQAELHALVLIQTLLEQTGSGFLSQQLSPVRKRFEHLLAKSAIDPNVLSDKIKMLNVAHRPVNNQHFTPVAEALLCSRTLRIVYLSRGDGRTTERVISPQRLVFYRGNWYLDCWCHLRRDLRTFALECIKHHHSSDENFHEVSSAQLDQHFTPSYGIFAGAANRQAVLLFTPSIALRVSDEMWHPEQSFQHCSDGSAELTIPYDHQHPQELLRDILSYGDDIVVLAPTELRELVQEKYRSALQKYT